MALFHWDKKKSRQSSVLSFYLTKKYMRERELLGSFIWLESNGRPTYIFHLMILITGSKKGDDRLTRRRNRNELTIYACS